MKLSDMETAYKEFSENPLKSVEEGERDLLDRLIDATVYRHSLEIPIFLSETEKEKARAILKEVDGLSIAEAETLLYKCKLALSATKIFLS